eukprot:365197-Chlamydomonas_euryale.AAC.2
MLTAPPCSPRHHAHRATMLTAPPCTPRHRAHRATMLTAPPCTQAVLKNLLAAHTAANGVEPIREREEFRERKERGTEGRQAKNRGGGGPGQGEALGGGNKGGEQAQHTGIAVANLQALSQAAPDPARPTASQPHRCSTASKAYTSKLNANDARIPPPPVGSPLTSSSEELPSGNFSSLLSLLSGSVSSSSPSSLLLEPPSPSPPSLSLSSPPPESPPSPGARARDSRASLHTCAH